MHLEETHVSPAPHSPLRGTATSSVIPSAESTSLNHGEQKCHNDTTNRVYCQVIMHLMAPTCREIKNNEFKYNLETRVMVEDQGEV